MTLIKAVKFSDYSSPHYWPTWFCIGLMRVVVLMPLPLIVVLGSALGRMLYRLATQRRQIGEINLRIAFPDYSPKQIQQLNKACFRNLGTAVFEIGLSWWESKRLLTMYETEGLKHLKEAERQGKGVIILTAHFTCVEIGGPLLNQHVPTQVMYRRQSNELYGFHVRTSVVLHERIEQLVT